MKNNKKIYLITNHELNNIILEKSEYSFNTIIVKDDKSCSTALLTSSKKADLIIIMNNYFTSMNATAKTIKDISIPIIYCSINNLELEDKKSKIASLVPYVIHGFKKETNNVLIQTITKILNTCPSKLCIPPKRLKAIKLILAEFKINSIPIKMATAFFRVMIP